MANFNQVILAGRLTRDPQLSTLPSNTSVCEFGMAINRKWRSQSGEMREEVCFVEIRAYGRQAETLNQYMQKGRPLLVEGRLKYDQWEGKDGGKRSKLYVVVDTFQFLGDGGGGGGRDSDQSSGHGQPSGQTRGVDTHDEMPPIDAGAPRESEIPF